MKKPILASICLLLICSFAAGQDVTELTVIRSLLNVPPNTPVSSSSSVAAPKDSPLVVYLEVTGDTPERDKKVKDSLVQWIDEWGKGTPAKRRTLEIVSDSEPARVALIQFTDFPTEILAPQGDDVAGGSSSSSTITMSMMVYTYIIIKEAKSLTLLYRRKDPILSRSTIVPGDHLTSAITARLRKDIDKEIAKRAMKSTSEKDTKRPDYKLRDEFVRWLSSDESALKTQ